MRAMTSSLISLGQTASHSPMLVQPPKSSPLAWASATRLCRKAVAEFRRTVLAGKHEEIVKGGHGAPQGNCGQALVQAVEECGGARTQGLRQQAAPGVGRQVRAPRSEIAVRPVAEIEVYFGMGRRQAAQYFA
jgi:hypothetical protein